MREHKYRAWHKAEKRMYHVAILYPDASTVMLQIGDTLFSASFAEIELMDFIGRRGKNDTEIYEDDIVKADWCWTEPHRIIWPHDEYDFIEFVLDEANVEIIGNAWETPDLISSEVLPE